MRNTACQTRENRTITVNFQSEAAYFQLLGDRKAFLKTQDVPCHIIPRFCHNSLPRSPI
jgi:hypothetical protein